MSSEDFTYCGELLKSLDYDRWLASQVLPEPQRGAVQALYAFSAEIARIRENLREVLTGEMRLQFWRDILEGNAAESPVARALLESVRLYNLPRQPLLNLIEARVHDLYDDGFANLNDLEGYCGETCSVLFQLSGMVLGGEARALADAAGHGGVAYALAGLMSALPVTLARGQCFLPQDLLTRHDLTRNDLANPASTEKLRAVLQDLSTIAENHLTKAHTALAGISAEVQPAFLPLALVPATLKAIRANRDPAHVLSLVPKWRKPLALWWAARK